jgi:hypothetical protein
MKPVIKCSDCTKDKKCLRHYNYDSSEYIVLSPGAKEKRLMALEQENKILLEALGCCGISAKAATIEDGVRALIPEKLANQIDFKKLDAVIDKRFEGKEPKFKCEICGGNIASSDYASNAIERYAGSSLRILGVKITFWVGKEWIICTKCGDKIHARLQAGED